MIRNLLADDHGPLDRDLLLNDRGKDRIVQVCQRDAFPDIALGERQTIAGQHVQGHIGIPEQLRRVDGSAPSLGDVLQRSHQPGFRGCCGLDIVGCGNLVYPKAPGQRDPIVAIDNVGLAVRWIDPQRHPPAQVWIPRRDLVELPRRTGRSYP